MAWVRERTKPTERPTFVGEVSGNFFCGRRFHVVSVTDPYIRNLGILDRYITHTHTHTHTQYKAKI
jgi:hypothetical protein